MVEEEDGRVTLSMTNIKFYKDIVLSLAVISIWVLAVWIFPRLFLALSSAAISQSIKHHPFLHGLRGFAGIAALYLVIKGMAPDIVP